MKKVKIINYNINIKGSNVEGGKLSGEKVTGNVGGDLNIESKQDKNSYEEKNSSAGFGIGMPVGDKDSANKIGIFGSAGKSDVDSKYESVTDQSGIYAGKEGFDINVGENTDLKGGIISSEAEKDKNKISTGTLTYEDIKNKAEYEAGSIGVNVDTSKDAEKKDAGVTPNIGVGAKDDAESTTKATVSEGEIEIRDKENQKQDLSGLNRDIKNSLNKLGEIFDKTKVQEKQEFAGMFQEIAHTYIGNLTGKISKEEKAFLNSFVDGLIAQWTSGDFLAGASGTALLESMQSAIYEIEDPALKQIAAGALGAIAGEIVSGNAQAGASGAISTERDNHLPHEEQEKFVNDIRKAKTNAEKFDVIEKYYKISEEYRAKDPNGAEVMEQQLMDELAKLTKYDDAGKSFELTLNKDLGLHENLRLAKEFLGLSKVLSNALPNTAKDLVIMAAEESLTSSNILSEGLVQILDSSGNVIKEYNKDALSKEITEMILKEAAKGYTMYRVGKIVENRGIPKVVIITAQVGTIVVSNFVSY